MRPGEHGGIFLRLLFLLFFLGFLAVFYLARHPLMRLAGQTWVVDEPAAPSDALIVLGDDNYAADRAFHAAELYRQKVAPVVVASGRMLRRNVSVADVMERDLESFGVPSTSIVKLTHTAENTREEAVEAARLIRTRGWKRVLVVTSNYHARRARFILKGSPRKRVTLRRAQHARDSDFDPSNWWQTRQGQKLFLTELAGYLVARWELRSNKPEIQRRRYEIHRRQQRHQRTQWSHRTEALPGPTAEDGPTLRRYYLDLVIKGDIKTNEDLYIDGDQGTIHLSNGRVTVGPAGKIAETATSMRKRL